MTLSSPLAQAIRLIPPGVGDFSAQDLRGRFLVDERNYLSSHAQLIDAYEPQAGYVIVDGAAGQCAALIRVIHHGPAGFDLQRYLDPADYVTISDRSVEVAELIMRSDQRASTAVLQLALGFAAYLRLHQPDTVVSLSTRETAAHYDRLGMTVRWDVKIRARDWNTDVWLCYARPATVIVDAVLEHTPPLYRKAAEAYLSTVETSDREI